MKQTRINRMEAVNEIRSGKICTVKFVKRSDDSIRVMNGRVGVFKYLKGGKATYNAKEQGLITFFEFGKNPGYKSIPVERIISVNGKQVI